MLALTDVLLARSPPVVEMDDGFRRGGHVGDDESNLGEKLALVPLHLRYHPPRPLPGSRPVCKVMEENLRLLRGPSHRAGHQVVYLPREVVVRLEPDGIEDGVILQVLVDIRGGEGRVPPQVELLSHLPVSLDDGLQKLTPAVSRVNVAGAEYRPLAVPVVVEAEERMIARRFKEAVVGRALLVAVDRRFRAVYVEYHLLGL